MHLLYTIAVLAYASALRVASLFHPKAKKWVLGRENYFKKLPKINASKVIWFHCASLGEFDMALPAMHLLKEKQPDCFLLVTFFSPSGMEYYQKRKNSVDLAIYLPIDTPINAKRFIQHFHPEKAFFVKYEFWSNYIFEAKKQHIQVFSLSCLFRKDQRFFKWYGSFFRKTLHAIDFFYTQDEASGLLLKSIGISNYICVGDTRYDRVIENKLLLENNERISTFLMGEKAIILGSTWPKDELFLIPFILKNPQQKFILAPHTINEKHIVSIEKLLHGRTSRYTETGNNQVLLLNTIGHLASAYAYGKIAYVGGGFTGKLHNILEPSVFGLPVLFGPKFKKFPEASRFIEHGTGFTISTA
ncbi:MAG: hypothetical protein RJA13_299, partial [Bacteroidota bacterium]